MKKNMHEPCCECAKCETKCDGIVRRYDIPNGAHYCTSYVSKFKVAMGWETK